MKFPTRILGLALTLMILISNLSITAAAEGGILYAGIGFVNATGLNLRQAPGTDSPSLATANSGECVVVIDQQGDWYHVLYNLQEGYMSAQYLTVRSAENAELGYGSVIGTSVNLRSGPSTSHNKVGTASYGEKLYIIGLNQGWFKVLRDSGTCYIRSDYVELTEFPYENRASTNSPKYFRGGKSLGTLPTAAPSAAAQGGSISGGSILQTAQQYLGTPYVYGGASPSGFDCSGFVYYVYGVHGRNVGRTPAAQYSAGSRVDKASLQPGDIVLFAGTGGSGVSHSGIYAGNGQFIHSPNSRSVVSYSDLTSGYWSEHFYCGIRVA